MQALLAPLAAGSAWPDVPPDVPVFPYITYQGAGGRALTYLEKKRPDKLHTRLQVNVWATTRMEANAIARAIERRLVESRFTMEVYGAFTSLHEQSIKKYGTRQDFGIWYEAD
ncbi:DUF3168 domain-containing protein [Xanthomonas translucens pv. translucens]|uniref:DUF3168 domain-containing protein n=1 Tax=Xanthomonas campestris pv. translucens TaxID=343 RepID=UPI003F6EB2D4